ncbi:MAG TPA: DnaB-like helicase C-terminal domain-containing protein [Gemmatimonadaceae bacterium]|nr:DnaB-like helicase C-terminal domain-containing protein [Gemmatimonadaceae bacterium]
MDTIPTGFPSLDRLLGGGLRTGDLAVLGGDVASGKSALALAIALRAAAAGQSVIFLSGEMMPDRVLERALAIEGRARVDDLRQGALEESARARVGAAAVQLRDAAPVIQRLPSDGITGISPQLRGSRGPALAIVDSLESLARGGTSKEESEFATVSELKALALETGVAILATSQLPLLAPRSDRRPQLDDFGGLGAVKGLADVVLALYREAMYDTARDVEGATELLVRKNRNGATGYVDLYFYAQWMRFEDMLDPDR